MSYPWNVIFILGCLTLGLFVTFVVFPKRKPDAVLLGFFSVGLALIGVALVQPETVKFQGWEITKRVETIERNLRPFAIVDAGMSSRVKSRGIVYQTFSDGEFTWLTKGSGLVDYKFKLRTRPRFVEVRCDLGTAHITREKEDADGYEYSFSLSMYTDGDTHMRCIIEAFLHKS